MKIVSKLVIYLIAISLLLWAGWKTTSQDYIEVRKEQVHSVGLTLDMAVFNGDDFYQPLNLVYEGEMPGVLLIKGGRIVGRVLGRSTKAFIKPFSRAISSSAVRAGSYIGRSTAVIRKPLKKIASRVTAPNKIAKKVTSPKIDPKSVANKSPTQINNIAKEKKLISKGPDPKSGKGAYVDPATGKQRILCHPNCAKPHAHVNNPQGQRLGMDGKVVPPGSPSAHLPIKKP